jgi:hypothetical protein
LLSLMLTIFPPQTRQSKTRSNAPAKGMCWDDGCDWLILMCDRSTGHRPRSAGRRGNDSERLSANWHTICQGWTLGNKALPEPLQQLPICCFLGPQYSRSYVLSHSHSGTGVSPVHRVGLLAGPARCRSHSCLPPHILPGDNSSLGRTTRIRHRTVEQEYLACRTRRANANPVIASAPVEPIRQEFGL